MKKILSLLLFILALCQSTYVSAGTCDPSFTDTLPQITGGGGDWPPDSPGQTSPGYITHMEGVGGPGINFTYTPNVGTPVNFTVSFGASSGVVCTSQQAGGWGYPNDNRLRRIDFQGTGTRDTLFVINNSTQPGNLIWCTNLRFDQTSVGVWSAPDGISKVYNGYGGATQELWFAGYNTAGGYNKTVKLTANGNCRITNKTWIYADATNSPRITVNAPGASSAEFFVNNISQGVDSSPPFDLPTSTLTPGDEPNVRANVNWTVVPGTVIESNHASIFAPTRIATGNGFSCATYGTSGWAGWVKCWGLNDYGQVGTDSSTTTFDTPQDVENYANGFTLHSVSDLSAGHENACAVSGGGVFCWGRNQNGILGIAPGTLPFVDESYQVYPAGSGFKSVHVGRKHACALKTNGDLYCWGHGGYYQLGNSSNTATVTTPYLTATGVTKAQVNLDTTLWLKSGGVWAVGRDAYGEVGNGTPLSTQTFPVQIIGSGATDLWSAQYHSCAMVNGNLKCWGANQMGEIGLGTRSHDIPSPTATTVWSGTITNIAGGDETTCATFSTGAAKCIGYNAYGQLGRGFVSTDQLIPLAPNGFGSGVVAVSGNLTNICGFVGGHVKCIGDNTVDQIGDPAAGNPQTTPFTVFGF